MGNKRNRQKKRKKNGKKKLKIALLVIEIIIIMIMIFAAVMVFTPNSKVKLVKALTGCAPGRSFLGCVLGGDYEKYLQDSGFNSGDINQNKDLTISEKYTNIALFGTDTRSGDLTESSHTDSIIIVSVNNQTGEVKMASVYRDTVLEYSVDGNLYYDKATNAYAHGRAETSVNMLNSNLDLNIEDYAIVNFAGLANIIDALGGIDITITKDERDHTNNYLGETRNVTGMHTLNVIDYGEVHLTGLQATAYSRIRDAAFYYEDGTSVNNDYGRAARQRLVLEKIIDKAKSAGVSEMLKVAKTLLNKNTGEDQFLLTSISFDEILEMIPTMLEFNLAGSESFPSALTSGTDFMPITVNNKGRQSSLYTTNPDCVFAKGLAYNVTKLHEYLFGEEDYEPTKNVQDINDLLIEITGVEPETESGQSTTKSGGSEE